MKHLLILGATLLAGFSTFTAHAVDLFSFDKAQMSANARISDGDGETASPIAFTAKFNSIAMQQESIDVNLPHKVIAATKMANLGDLAEQVTPYVFEDQKGFATISTDIDSVQNVVIFDEDAEEIYKGVVEADGSISFTQENIGEFICTNYENVNASTGPQVADTSYYQSLNNLTLPQVTSLQSRPGASKVLYLDYLAGSVTSTGWNNANNDPIVYDNYSYDSDASTFSLLDLQSMYAGWAETAEDYAPFDINVTTDLAVYNAATHRNKSKIIATSTNWRGSGGVAYINKFGRHDHDFFTIGWTFNKGFGSMGMTNSHESGHQMGLSHDGTSARTYYGGHGNAGPIMGGPFGRDFVHWNNGSYPDANQTQNDLAIIQAKLGTVADDHGNNNGTATAINAQEIVGFISPAGLAADIDVFSLTLASSQSVSLTVRSLFEQANGGGDNTAGGLNLSAKIELKDSSNTLLQQKIPTNVAANNNFIYSGTLTAGTYYLTIEPQAYTPSDFNEYGNGGFYQILNNLSSVTAPDLVVESPSVSDASLDAGQNFTLTASVKNQGDSISAATTLTYYRSTDAAITSSDVNVGNDAVGTLAENASSAESIGLSAPTSPGSYYYGACVASVSGESNTGNNCSAGVLVTVASTVDLIVESPAVTDTTLNSGQSFTFSASVTNQGNSSSAATTLTYYRSTNSTISSSDASVGTDAVGSLASNASGAENINLTAPSNPGSYYYGACVASVSGESNTGNNCSAGVLVTVASTVDLIVESPAVNDATLSSRQNFTFSASVKNQGNASSAATNLTYYRSTNSTISSSDASIGTDAVSSLAANASGAESISLTAPASPGDYYYGACVTAVLGESNTGNNCSAGVLVTVGSVVDLIVESPAVNDATLSSGQNFTFSASVKNQGNASSVATNLTYYRSTNSTISSSDASVGTDAVSSLSANASGAESISLTAPASPGDYYYGACVAAVSGESNTGNNCSAGVLVTVASTVDLIVESPAVNDATLSSGQNFTFSASVKNQGNASSAATTLTYRRSDNSTITIGDPTVGSDAIGALAADALSAETINLTAPTSPGDYYYGACVTAVSGESDTRNNCSDGVLVTVASPVSADSYEPNNSSLEAKPISKGATQIHSIHIVDDEDWLKFTLTSPAQNLSVETSGSGDSDTRLWLYDSTLNELGFNDNAGPNGYSKIVMDAPLAPGTYYILVDEFANDELIESYTINLSFDSEEAEDDSMCIPIQASNGSMVLICL